MGVFEQDGFAARFEWGEAGLRRLAPHVDVLVIVDVLSFSTAVDVATARGAHIVPCPSRDGTALAAQHAALVASHRRQPSAEHPYSLSPSSLTTIPKATRLVLPSLNGSTLTSLAAPCRAVVAGCLRNARAVAAWATRRPSMAVIAAGELTREGTLRFAIEDLIGAGAILRHIPAEARSPEAEVAVAAFTRFERDLLSCLNACASGRELAAIGFSDDVAIAAELDVSAAVPLFIQPGWYADVAAV